MTPTRRNILKALTASPVLLSPTLLSACAGDSGSSGSDASGEGTLNIGQISDSVAFFPLYIAEQKKFFEDEGLTLGERPRLGTGAKLAAALGSGSIDIGAGVLTDVFNLAKVDDSARLTTSLVTEYYVDIIVGKGITADGSLDQKVKALKGKKIGITGPGSGTEALVTYLFKLSGLDKNTDAELVNLGGDVPAAVGALKAGRVDALSFFQPVGQICEATNVGKIYISPAAGDVPDMKGALQGIAFTTQEVLDEKGDEVAAFQKAIGRSMEIVQNDPDQTRELLAGYNSAASPAVIDLLVPLLKSEMPAAPTVTTESYEVGKKFHLDSGLVEETPEYDAVVPEEFRA